jgi:DNA-binding MarR family transcriptional regulator
MKSEQDQRDHVDRLRGQWARELPDLDTHPMSVLGRAYRLSNLVRPSIEATFASFGLDRGEFDVISTLRRSGRPYRLTPTELYTSLMISSGGLTHRLGRLEKAGLVTREPSPEDGRSLAVVLTEEGARRAEAAFRADMASEARLLEGLDEAERAALAALLRKLNLAVERRLAEPSGDGRP